MENTKHSWDFVDPPSSDCYCPMCDNILQEPMLTNCCGSHFCRLCIEPVFQDNKPCPNKECLETDYLCIIDKPKWKKILELDVICPLRCRGCNWKGEVGTQDKHLDVKKGDCEYIDVECTNGCGEEMERYELSEHLDRFCHRRPYTCEHCGIENVFEVITKHHIPECPAHPITCQNNCGFDDITRSSYPEHLLKCPEQEVECEFTYVGCTKQIPRKNMAQHQQDDMYTHLSLQTAFASKQLMEKDKKLKEISEQLKKVSEHWEVNFKKMSLEMDKCNRKMEQLSSESESMKHKLERKEGMISTLRQFHSLEFSTVFSGNRKLTLMQGDIVHENVDIIVNAAESFFGYDYGVARALNVASNGLLKNHTARYMREHPGENICAKPFLTSAGGFLDCKKILHAFGPTWEILSNAEAQSKLYQCIKDVLECAENEKALSIAIPAISAGGLSGIKKLVAKYIIKSIRDYKFTKPCPILADVRIVILDTPTFSAFAEHFKV